MFTNMFLIITIIIISLVLETLDLRKKKASRTRYKHAMSGKNKLKVVSLLEKMFLD